MFTTWDVSQNRKIKFVCARYGLHTITADFLVRTILDIIVSLEMYGFIVIPVTGDGAAENRATFKRLATQSAREALPTALIIDNNFLELLDLKIAFPRPSKSNTTIYIMGDMPHLVKKVVNCLEMSGNHKSQRHLEYDNANICLSFACHVFTKFRKKHEKIPTTTGNPACKAFIN